MAQQDVMHQYQDQTARRLLLGLALGTSFLSLIIQTKTKDFV